MTSQPAVDNADGVPANEELSCVVHDLRNCLYTMKLGLQALKSADENIEIWRIIDAEQERSIHLLEELVAIARSRPNRKGRACS